MSVNRNRELLGWLNPRSPRWELGRGGIPDLTAEDVAGALGMVPAGMGRDLIALTWAQHAAVLPAVRRQVFLALWREWARRRDLLVVASLRKAEAEIDGRHEDVERARFAIESARRKQWPDMAQQRHAEVYRRLGDGVLAEFISPGCCPVCRGTRNRMVCDRLVECSHCAGSGRVRQTNAQRAAWLETSASRFAERWRHPWEWLFALVVREEKEAAKRLDLTPARDSA